MLKPSCEEFRARYEPLGESGAELEAHRRSCGECSTWAERLSAFTGAEQRSPMPDRLRARLLAIAREQAASAVDCDDVERLYEATWRKARRGEADPAVAEHLESCEHCRALYTTLAASFLDVWRPIPRALVRRLWAIFPSGGSRGGNTAERPQLPLFVRDGRLAIAASAILTASLLLLVGNPDPRDLVRTTTETVSSRATVLAEAGEERRQALLERLSETLETNYERGREALTEHGRAYQEIWYEARGFYESEQWRQLLGSVTLEGERDGES